METLAEAHGRQRGAEAAWSSSPPSQEPIARHWRIPAADISEFSQAATDSQLASKRGSSGPTPGNRGGTTWRCASIIPAVFATAAETNASDERILSAVTLGYEVAVRIAASRDFAALTQLAAPELRQYSSEFWAVREAGALRCRAGLPEKADALLERSLVANDHPGAAVLSLRSSSRTEICCTIAG